jgi:hypothetical protein
MGLLQVLDDAPGFAKVSIQGPQGSGKSRTAVETAITLHKLFRSQKPVAFYDTEQGSDFLQALLHKRTGHKPVRIKTRSFDELLGATHECLAGVSDIFLIDSITHVWRELQDGYMKAVNSKLKYPKTRMSIDDIMNVKKLWEPWPNLFLNSELHIIVCGREGNEWGSEEDEDTGKRELVAVGKKMKVEGEFGYEAHLQIAMAAQQVAESVVRKKDKSRERHPRRIVNVATVLKDRFDVINGQMFDMPTGQAFMPHFELLNPAAHRPVDTAIKSDRLVDVGEDGFAKEKRQRAIACEEIQGELVAMWPGQTAEEKRHKADMIFRVFGTRSWTNVEGFDSTRLRNGLARIREELQALAASPATAAAELPAAVAV